jgi:nitrite reductase (NADH) small subunit
MTDDACWVDVMQADDLWIGDAIGMESAAGPLLLINLDGAIRAYENRCPHMGTRLSDGEFANGVIICASHRWEFCAQSGQGINPKGQNLNTRAIRIVDGRIQVALQRTQAS